MACPITVKLACQFPPPPLLSQHPHPSNIPFISWVVSCSIEHRQLCVCVCVCMSLLLHIVWRDLAEAARQRHKASESNATWHAQL